jgi:cyanophycinase
MKLRALILLISLATTAFAEQVPSRGHLLLIGGGEKPTEAMGKFVELAGGPSAPIVVIPTASSEPDTGAYYVDLFFTGHGCTDVTPLEIRTKGDAGLAAHVAAVRRARGIFFSGGDQRRILDALEGTPVLEAIHERWRDGAVIGGTSAGTACQSPLMITGDGDFDVIHAGAVELRSGLGLFPGVVVDQHFIARQRFNRLLSVILEHPDLLGVGVDEATAVWVRPDSTFQVIGRSAVVVIDARGAAVKRETPVDGKASLGARDVRIHVLVDGEVFDMNGRPAPREAASSAP